MRGGEGRKRSWDISTGPCWRPITTANSTLLWSCCKFFTFLQGWVGSLKIRVCHGDVSVPYAPADKGSQEWLVWWPPLRKSTPASTWQPITWFAPSPGPKFPSSLETSLWMCTIWLPFSGRTPISQCPSSPVKPRVECCAPDRIGQFWACRGQVII